MCAGVAQLVEHRFCNPRVGSSSLSASTTASVMELVDIADLKSVDFGRASSSLAGGTKC